MLLADHLERTQALDIKRSFIVQAPAGSGKTELLVQRFLVALSQSASPEAVIALTFTRKAAAEMKQRVLEALELGASKTPPNALYQRTRWELGRRLHEWQIKQQWHLLSNPNRLNVQTIDSFYAQIAKKAPLQSGITSTTQVLDNPEPLYQLAIQKLFEELEKGSALSRALADLAKHLNNDTAQIERLLVHLLAHRDQWLSVVPESMEGMLPLRKLLEQCLHQVNESACHIAQKEFANCGVANWKEELEHLVTANFYPTQTIATALLSPSEFWKLIADLLLTTQGQWRRLMRQNGLHHHPKPLQKSIKASLKEWITLLQPKENIRLALINISRLPPVHYTETQWELLESLFYILNVLLVILDFVFRQHNQVDYIAIALQASQLLGEADNPTEVLLRLDYQIQHILVDEFQDTSLHQLRFLNRLTEGWQPHDGRTLFLVGDPMQSIYSFRKAQARLFRLVQKTGLGTCPLESIILATNFRSTPALIEWINRHFESMKTLLKTRFSQESLFIHSKASDQLTDASLTPDAVEMHWLDNASADQEAHKIVSLVKRALQEYPTSQIATQPIVAILGRARQHLLSILPKLRAANIGYQAVDIETLLDKPIIQDLLALTRALTHLADDIAWLALLRAPWCGASLADLYALKQACEAHHPPRLVWDQLHHLDHLAISPDSKARLARFVKSLEPIVESYGRISLKKRIEQAWYRLGGPATQPSHTWHSQDVVSFFQCIDAVQVGETIMDNSLLEAKLKKTYATPSNVDTIAPVILMTIHKAKGLEFDTVILPSLHKSTRHQSRSLILFDEFPTLTAPHLLLAPIKSSDTAEPDAIYRYLRENQYQQQQAETMRLLYVACTRAKKKLHLLGSLQRKKSGELLSPSIGTFLHWLWPALCDADKTVSHNEEAEKSTPQERWLKRMSQESLYPLGD